MIIENILGKEYSLYFDKITYICSIDINLSNYVYETITKYFSKYKYSDDDLKLYNDYYPIIKDKDNIEIARTRYEIISINSILDINNYLDNKKDSLLRKYYNIILQDVNFQKHFERLEIVYLDIVKEIEKQFSDESIVEINDVNINAEFVLDKDIIKSISTFNTNIEKIKQLILFITSLSLSNNKEYILYLNNVDNYLDIDQCKEITKIVEHTDYIKLIIQSTNTNYLDFKESHKVNFVYNNSIDTLPTNDILLKKLNNNYEKNIVFKEEELIKWLEKYSIFLYQNLSITKEDVSILNALKAKNNIDNSIEHRELENSIII